MRIALAQFDSWVGDVNANLSRIGALTAQASAEGAELVVFPELATHGYFLGHVPDSEPLEARDPRLLALAGDGTDVVVGFHEAAAVRRYNSAAYLSAGGAVHVHRKLYLPTYLRWEERKHSSPGQSLRAFDTRHGRAAILICNDAWQLALPWLAAQDGAELLIVPANSAHHDARPPRSLDTIGYWEQLLGLIARLQQCWVVFVNRAGTEAGARFWGGSRVLDPDGEVVALAPMHEPDLIVVDIEVAAARRRRDAVPLLAEARLSLIEREVRRLIDEGGDG